jgi:hypothetical protein
MIREPTMAATDIAADLSPKSQVLRLYVGKIFTGVTVEPDGQWPSMWRVRKGDRLSDMVNLTRARDAAIGWFTQGRASGGLRPGEVPSWRIG